MRLVDARLDMWVRISAFEGGARFTDRLLRHGLYPGDRARVVRAAPLDGPLLVEVNGREIALGPGVAARIIVELEP